jgi:hypothetical protein
LADAQDLKSWDRKRSCGFDSRPRHSDSLRESSRRSRATVTRPSPLRGSVFGSDSRLRHHFSKKLAVCSVSAGRHVAAGGGLIPFLSPFVNVRSLTVTRNERLKRALTVIVAVILGFYIGDWLLMGPPVIRVENHSAHEIRSIEVAGVGFNERISRLGPGESVCVRPSGIPGESDLELRADSDAGRIEATDLAYFEASGGYHVRVVISPDLKVNSPYDGSVWMAFCGIWR